MAVKKSLQPERLTWNIIMEEWKIMFLSKWVICRFHVDLPRCTSFPPSTCGTKNKQRTVEGRAPTHFQSHLNDIMRIGLVDTLQERQANIGGTADYQRFMDLREGLSIFMWGVVSA